MNVCPLQYVLDKGDVIGVVPLFSTYKVVPPPAPSVDGSIAIVQLSDSIHLSSIHAVLKVLVTFYIFSCGIVL